MATDLFDFDFDDTTAEALIVDTQYGLGGRDLIKAGSVVRALRTEVRKAHYVAKARGGYTVATRAALTALTKANLAATVTALTALTGLTTLKVTVLNDGAGTPRVYRWDSTSSTTASDSVLATDEGSTGRWIAVEGDMSATGGGTHYDVQVLNFAGQKTIGEIDALGGSPTAGLAYQVKTAGGTPANAGSDAAAVGDLVVADDAGAWKVVLAASAGILPACYCVVDTGTLVSPLTDVTDRKKVAKFGGTSNTPTLFTPQDGWQVTIVGENVPAENRQRIYDSSASTWGAMPNDAILDGDFAGTAIGRLRRTGAGAYDVLADNLAATADPTVNDDVTGLYGVGSLWVRTNVTPPKAWFCTSAADGAAVWREVLHKHNFAAAAAPVVTDDSAAGYSVGSLWIDTTNDTAWVCVDNTAASALWQRLGQKDNLAAAAAPTVNDDGTPAGGYQIGSLWIDTTSDVVYLCTDNTDGAAVWKRLGGGDKLDGTAAPTVNDDVNLGFVVGSLWMDTTHDLAFICLDASNGTAVWLPLTTKASTSNPTVNDDLDLGFAAGSKWVNTSTGEQFTCVSAADGAADWRSNGGFYLGAGALDDADTRLGSTASADFATTKTVPANSLRLGAKVRVIAQVYVSAQVGADEIALDLVLGSLTLASVASVDAAVGAAQLSFEGFVTEASDTGKFSGIGTGAYTGVPSQTVHQGGSNLDMTAAMIAKVTCAWTGGNAGDVAELLGLSVEVLN